MKRFILPLLLVLVLLLAAGTLLWPNLQGLRPALSSPTEDITEVFSRRDTAQAQGEQVDFPLEVPEPLRIGLFASGLNGPRDIVISPEGAALVSLPKSGEVVVLPDADNDGSADENKVVLSGLNKPHGLAFYNGKLFVAEETRLVRYTWNEATLAATEEKQLLELPVGGRHTSRTIAFDQEGNLFLSLGSRCDTCFESDPWIATVIKTDVEGNSPKVYATGLRNAVFLEQRPNTNQIWVTEMGRDLLGDTLPPDEINLLQQGGNYGWPICYGNKVYDSRFGEESPEYCQNTIAPKFNLPAHVAPLGLAFIDAPQFPSDWRGDLLVAEHGSWNSSTPVGYKIVRLTVEGDTIIGQEDFLTGFVQGSEALGRPVDVEFDQKGTLYVSDDKAGAIYRITRTEE